MTDEEILEEYKEIIENEVNEIYKKKHIVVKSTKLSILLVYQDKFLERLKNEVWENAKRMIKKGRPTELTMEVVRALATEVAVDLSENI